MDGKLYKIKPLRWIQGGGGEHHFLGTLSNGIIKAGICRNETGQWRWIWFPDVDESWHDCDSLEQGKKFCELAYKRHVLVYVEKAD